VVHVMDLHADDATPLEAGLWFPDGTAPLLRTALPVEAARSLPRERPGSSTSGTDGSVACLYHQSWNPS